MALQSLAEFQSTFTCVPVEVEIKIKGMDAFTVYLKPLTSAQRDAFEASVVGKEGKDRDLRNLRARLVADCLVDETGKPVGNAKDLGDLDARLVGELFDEVRKLNGMDMDDENEGELGKE